MSAEPVFTTPKEWPVETYRERIARLYPCRYPMIHKDGKSNGCPDCSR